MIRLLIDENFDHDILRGLQLRLPNLDSVTVQAAGLKGADDRVLLNWAVAEQRILVTHDLNAVPKLAHERLKAGVPLAGVFAVPASLAIGEAIDQLALLVTCSHEGEWNHRVLFLPL